MCIFGKRMISVFILCAIGFATATTTAEEVFKEDFSNYKDESKDGLRKAVDVKDFPELKYALRLEAVMDKDQKTIRSSWTGNKFDIGTSDKVTVEYYIKPETDSARYALFVKDCKGNQLVAPIIRDGKIECCSYEKWEKIAPLKYREWHHIKYVIHLLSESYDIYVDDMEKPCGNEIKYRNSECGVPVSLWTESSETASSISYFGKITVSSEMSPVFPPVALALAPHYIGNAVKAEKAPAVDGKGNDECWKKAESLFLDREAGNVKEKSSAKVMWDDKSLYILFQADATEIAKRASGETARDGRVWLNDCFEIFIDPMLSRKNYFHLAGNSIGTVYDASRTGGVRDDSWNCDWTVAISKDEKSWTAEIAIPFESFGKVPQTGDLWGLNICRENPVLSEISAWRPMDSFHNPGMFGKLLFTDPVYQSIPREDQVKVLGEKLYNTEKILKEALGNLRKIESGENGAYFMKPCYNLKGEIEKLEKYLGSPKNFVSYYKNAEKAEKFLGTSISLCSDAERLTRFFAKDSENAKRGYAVCFESSMDKIPLENYSGSSKPVPELTLAGREYGSFQLALLAKPGTRFDSVTVKASELKDKNGKALAGSKIDSFSVEYVKTAKSTINQEIIPDVLRPGTEFKFSSSTGTVPLWFDVFIPANAQAGDYSATISVTPANGKTADIPVKIKVLPFTLPLKPSMPTAFCFVDEWAEKYYMAKMPSEKRRAYFQFIMDHRLEPMNLWLGNKKLDMNEEDLDWCEQRGKSMLFLQVTRVNDCEQYYKDMIKKYEGRLTPIFFGYDEILMSTPENIAKMKEAYKGTKEKFPDVPRLNTSKIDEKLFGYVDIWCPLFNHFEKVDAEKRTALGETVWWYPTDYPLAPYANFNIDSDGIDPRAILWMNWKLDIKGILYWGLNREWVSNYQEAERLTDKEKYARGLEWMTPDVQRKIKKGLRWPAVPWIPYFRSVVNPNASPSATNGGGNLMYPGPDWQPIPSTRLKNLRDGLQDYEYLVMLKKNLELLRKAGSNNKELIARAEKALNVNKVTTGAASYTKDAEVLDAAKAEIAGLIIETQNELKKGEAIK